MPYATRRKNDINIIYIIYIIFVGSIFGLFFGPIFAPKYFMGLLFQTKYFLVYFLRQNFFSQQFLSQFFEAFSCPTTRDEKMTFFLQKNLFKKNI